jgi:hypothetical protein
MLGVFNFFDILTVAKPKQNTTDAVTVLTSNETGTSFNALRKPSAFFFLMHYGFFHAVYVVFIATMEKSGPFQWDFFKYFLLAFIAGQIITFIQHKRQQRHSETSVGAMMALPYLRILPMHLTIILPNFLPVSSIGLFVVLKGVADVIMYIATKPATTGKEADTTMLASEHTINM